MFGKLRNSRKTRMIRQNTKPPDYERMLVAIAIVQCALEMFATFVR